MIFVTALYRVWRALVVDALRALLRMRSTRGFEYPLPFSEPPVATKSWMLPSGSTRPDQPILNVSKVPASSLLSDVTKSVESTLTLMPTAASSDWMNCASRRAAVPVGTMRFTVGFEMPDCWTSCFASVGSYGVHFNDLSKYGLAGESGVQPGSTVPPKTTLFIVLRSIAISNASRSFGLEAIGVPMFENGFPIPFLFPMLIVKPW